MVAAMPTPRLLVVALLLSACASSTAPPASTAALVDEPAQPGDPVVTVLEPGAEPRTRLRYRVPPGPQAPMVMQMGMTMAMGIGGMSPPAVKLPLITMTMSVDVTKVQPNGTMSPAFKVSSVEVAEDPGAPAVLIAKLKEGMAKLVGMSIEADVTARGFARNVKVKVPDGAPPDVAAMADSMRTATQQAVAPLPAEPVGAGARWRVASNVDTGALVVQQTALMTLEQRPEGRAVLAIAAEQTADPQPLKARGFPPGASASVESFKSTGQGKTDIRLDSLTPRGSMGIRSKMAGTIVMNEARSKMTMDMVLDMKIAPGERR